MTGTQNQREEPWPLRDQWLLDWLHTEVTQKCFKKTRIIVGMHCLFLLAWVWVLALEEALPRKTLSLKTRLRGRACSDDERDRQPRSQKRAEVCRRGERMLIPVGCQGTRGQVSLGRLWLSR